MLGICGARGEKDNFTPSNAREVRLSRATKGNFSLLVKDLDAFSKSFFLYFFDKTNLEFFLKYGSYCKIKSPFLSTCR